MPFYELISIKSGTMACIRGFFSFLETVKTASERRHKLPGDSSGIRFFPSLVFSSQSPVKNCKKIKLCGKCQN